jgi:16S rRNA G966 N2-methylase RsmD
MNSTPTASEIAEGYRQFATDEIEQWHFPMMNDEPRNTAYETALGAAIRKNKGGVVLEIGSGSGLLAMMAIRQGADRVITCEAVPAIARKAAEIIKHNGYADRIQVINKLSTDVVIGKDISEPADMLVTEIFDNGLLGEGAFVAIEHAKKNLLKPGAPLIPRSVRVWAMCIESQEVFENHRVGQVAGFDLSPFNEFANKGYLGYHLDKMDYRALSAPQTIFEFDFHNIPGTEAVPVEFKISQAGLCHAVAYWYELKLDDNTIVSTAPGLPKLSSWRQAVQLAEIPNWVEAGETFKVMAHHNADAIWFTD